MSTNVTLKGLVRRFGDATAVDHVDLEVKNGEFFTLLGPSGCGKTTTLRLIAGLDVPTAGEISVGDRVVSAPELGVFIPPDRRRMGMVFQSYAIWPHMTVFDNVAFPLKRLKVPKQEVRERTYDMLKLVGLGALADRPAPNLSGGQQQRVALARALVPNPEVLLLDEPLSNLDAQLREQMRYEIRSLQERLGITTIFVTHDQEEAMALSDRAAVMSDGHVEQLGAPRDIYERPESRYVMNFLGGANEIPARVRVIGNISYACVADAEIPIDSVGQLHDGEEVSLGFRSESVSIADGGANLHGMVESATYMGGYVRYTIRVEGTTISLRLPAQDALPSGSPIGLRLDGSKVMAWPTNSGKSPSMNPIT